MANRTAIRVERLNCWETGPCTASLRMNASIRERSQLVETGAACAIILRRIPIQLDLISPRCSGRNRQASAI